MPPQNLQAGTFFEMDITYNYGIPLYGNEIIQVYLGTDFAAANINLVTPANTNNRLGCQISFTSNYLLSNIDPSIIPPLPRVQKCDLTSVNPIQIQLLEPSFGRTEIMISLTNLIYPTSSTSETISINVIRGSITLVQNASITLAALNSILSKNFSPLERYLNYELGFTSLTLATINPPVLGMIADYEFDFTVPEDLFEATTIYIVLPNNFEKIYNKLICKISSNSQSAVIVPCAMQNAYPYGITVYNLPNINNAVSNQLYVYGLTNPGTNSVTTIPFYLYTDAECSRLYYSLVTFPSALSTIPITNYILIGAILFSTYDVYNVATTYIAFSITGSAATSTTGVNYLRLIYPQEFDLTTSNLISPIGPCATVNTQTNISNTHTCTNIGNEVYIQLSSNFAASTTYNLSIQNILNPAGGICGDFRMDIFSSNYQTLFATNFDLIDKYIPPIFLESAQPLQVSDISGNLLTSITLPIGVTSQILYIAPGDGSVVTILLCFLIEFRP